MTVQEAFQDQDFMSLPPTEKIKALSAIDADFATLPVIEQFRVIVPPDNRGFLSKEGNYLKEAVLGIPEAALSLGTGVVGSGAGLVAGNITSAYEGIKQGIENMQGKRTTYDWGNKAAQVRDATRDILTYQPTTESGKALTNLVAPVIGLPFQGVQGVLKTGGKLAATPFLGEYPTKEKYPNLDYTLDSGAEAGAWGLTPGVINKVGKVVKGEVTPAQATSSVLKIKSAVQDLVNKGIAPGVQKMRGLVQRNSYFKDAETVARDIVGSKDSIELTDPKTGGLMPAGSLPANNYQHLQAITQGLDNSFKSYNDIKNSVGETVEVPLQGAVNELNSFAKGLEETRNPRYDPIVSTVKEYASRLEEDGSWGVDKTQNALKIANMESNAFNLNPNFETATPAAISNIIAGSLREALGSTIDREVGPGYQDFRNKYKAYKTVQEDVAHRATVSGRQKTFGFFDYGNMLTGLEATKALLTLDPIAAGKSIAVWQIKKHMQKMNQPDYQVEKAYKAIDQEFGKSAYDLSQNPNLPPIGRTDFNPHTINEGIPMPENSLVVDRGYQPNPRTVEGIPMTSGLEMDRQKIFSAGNVQPRLPGTGFEGINRTPEPPSQTKRVPIFDEKGNVTGFQEVGTVESILQSNIVPKKQYNK